MKTIWISIGLLAAVCGCVTDKGGEGGAPAGSAPYAREAALGPYSVKYGTDGTNDVLRISKGEENVYSKSGNNITVYADNRSLFDYVCSSTSTVVAAYMVHVRDSKGNVAFTLMDENADGVFDRKIDYGTKAVYEWKDNQWMKWKK